MNSRAPDAAGRGPHPSPQTTLAGREFVRGLCVLPARPLLQTPPHHPFRPETSRMSLTEPWVLASSSATEAPEPSGLSITHENP